mgnify:CR=1 FL=1
MKQDVAVISLDAYAGQFYAQQVQELFGERITVCSYSVRDGSIEHMPRRYDLYMVTTDAFDSLGDLHQYVPIDGEMMEIHRQLEATENREREEDSLLSMLRKLDTPIS